MIRDIASVTHKLRLTHLVDLNPADEKRIADAIADRVVHIAKIDGAWVESRIDGWLVVVGRVDDSDERASQRLTAAEMYCHGYLNARIDGWRHK